MRRHLASWLRRLAALVDPQPSPEELGYEMGQRFKDSLERVHHFSRGFVSALYPEEPE